MPQRGVLTEGNPSFSFGLIAAVLVGLCCWQSAWAVQLNVTHYDTRDGIPQVQVLTVHQCRTGYIWLGTYSGLSRYNGDTFTHFRTQDGLSSNFITALATDGEGRLWVATGAGLCYQADRDRFECPDYGELATTHVHSLHVKGSELWAATDAGLYHVDGDRANRVDLPGDRPDPVVFDVTSDHAHRLWVGTGNGLFHRANGSFDVVSLPADAGADVQASALAADGDAVWIGTNRGLFHWGGSGDPERVGPDWLANRDIGHLHLDRKARLWISTATGLVQRVDERFERYTTRNRLASDIIHQTFLDREDILWLAHDSGLSKLLPSAFSGYTVDSGLVASFVRAMAEDAQGRLWIGTRSGVQVLPRIDGEWVIDEQAVLSVADGLPDERIYSIAFPQPGEVLLATSQGLVSWHEDRGLINVYTEADGLPSNRSRALLVDSRGRIWVSTILGTVLLNGTEITSTPVAEVDAAYAMRISEDGQGRLWFASIQQGLLMIDADGSHQQWLGADGLTDEMLWDVAPSASGSVWVGSNGEGLFHVRADGEIRRYTTADGLADDFVWQVLEDREGRVWAYTNRGLSMFDGRTFTNFREADGLLHLEGAATASIETSDGSLWFGSADGLMRYEAGWPGPPQIAPTTVIEQVLLGDTPLQPGAHLPPRPGSLQVRYAGLSFHDEDAVRFRYRLADVEREWTDAGAVRSITYAGLGGGEYTFEVMARSAAGIWSEDAARFPFSIAPPYWATWWFWSLVALTTMLLAWVGLRVRDRAADARQTELQRLVDERTLELSQANERLEHMSRTDPLTGLPNRRYLVDRIDHDIADIRRAYRQADSVFNRDMIFMMIDLDHFKAVNDRFGHDAGDRVLREQAELILDQLRESDDLIRWGGEEFLVVARHAEARLSPVIADRIVQAVRNQRIRLKRAEMLKATTCSIGIATYPFLPGQTETPDWERVVQLADQAVYKAKSLGRDGWVWLRPGPALQVDDPAALIDGVKRDLDGLVASGEIEIMTSFD